MNLATLGTEWIAAGQVPPAVGLWWLVLPLLGLGVWFYARDGRPGRWWWQ